jgi:hypothetical protein
MVLAWHGGPITTGGSPRKFIARTFGVPKSTETWLATSGSIGLGEARGIDPVGSGRRGDEAHRSGALRITAEHIFVLEQSCAIETT